MSIYDQKSKIYVKNRQTNLDNQKRKIKHWLAVSFSKDQTDIGKEVKTDAYEPFQCLFSWNGENKMHKGKDDANNSKRVSPFLKTLL